MAQKTLRRQQKQLPRRQVLKHPKYAKVGAQATQKAGRRNARGRNVLVVLHVLQDGFGEVTSCFSEHICLHNCLVSNVRTSQTLAAKSSLNCIVQADRLST